MKITTKYSIDDKVWKIKQEWLKKRLPCDLCDGGGAVVVVGKEGSHTCPVCAGIGSTQESGGRVWRVSRRAAKVCMVMANVDGLGTGLQYRIGKDYVEEVDVFKTQKAAHAECVKRNGEKAYDIFKA